MENIGAVMNLGEMYNVAECLTVCSKFVKNNLNDENVCRNYELAIVFNQQDLKRACEIVIGINTNTVLKSTGFLACDRNTLANILEHNWLSCTEVELFDACMSWVKAISGQDILTNEIVHAHLGDPFYKIRFRAMSLQEFAALIPSYGKIFSFDEQQEIIQMIADEAFQSKLFNGNHIKRNHIIPLSFLNNSFVCNRLISNYPSNKLYQIGNIETTVFSINEPLLLRTFSCANMFTTFHRVIREIFLTYINIVEVNEPNNEVLLYKGYAHLNPNKFTNICLTKPVLIRPGYLYEIRLKQTLPPNCCTAILMKLSVEFESGIIVQFHRNNVIENDTSVARGLIHSLGFRRI